MGGGAGINFSLRIANGFCRWRPNKQTFTIDKVPDIEMFDMLGYMDGMCKVRGDLLRIVNFEIEPMDKGDTAWLKRCGIDLRRSLYISQPQRNTIEHMMWGGYVRGDIRVSLPSLSFMAELEVECIGVNASFGIEAAGDEFFYFYEDVFENWSTNTGQDNDDNRQNYGT